MPMFEYSVVPAPRRGTKVRGARTTAERFAHALTVAMNAMARDGWEYLRADTLPCEERVGLTGKATAFQNMLVFRRPVGLSDMPAQGAVNGSAAVPGPDATLAPVSAAEVPPDHLPAPAVSPSEAPPRPIAALHRE